MGLPQRTFFTVQEVAIRWDCSLDDLAGWAINGKPDTVAVFIIMLITKPGATACAGAFGPMDPLHEAEDANERD